MNKLIYIFVGLLCLVLALRLFLYYSDSQKNIPPQAQEVQEKKNETPEHVHIVFLDIGQGDATFIEFPNGEQMLIDCAVDARVLEALGRVMPFYDKTIDYLVITHPDRDHYGGCVDVMKRFTVNHIVYNGLSKEYDEYWQTFRTTIDEEVSAGARYTVADRERLWDISGVDIHFLYPVRPVSEDARIPGDEKEADSNDTSIVLNVRYGESDILLTGDAQEPLERFLIQTYGKILDVDVLKAGHHGSNSSSSGAFIDATSPEHAVISCGKDNPYGHPAPRVVKRFERAFTRVWRTDTHGDIILKVKKDSIEVEV